MLNFDDLPNLLRQFEKLKEERFKETGGYEQVMAQIRKYKCKTIAEAQTILERLEDEVRDVNTEYLSKIKDLKKKHRKQLEKLK